MNPMIDERLWRIAKKRASFKRSFTVYVLVNLFLWAIWYVTIGHNRDLSDWHWLSAWPIWPTLGWGLGIAFQYFDAYGDGDRQSSTEREYERLKQQQQRTA